MRRSLIARALAVAAAASLALTACGGGGNPLSNGGSGAAPSGSNASPTIVVGSANFTENQILAEIYAQALTAKGVNVTKKLSIGSREAYFPGLQDGSIDLIPEYTGVLLQYLNKSATETSADDVFSALQKALPPTLTVLDKSAAEDKDGVVVSKDTATKYNATSIADLAPTVASSSSVVRRSSRPAPTASRACRRSTTARSRTTRRSTRVARSPWRR